MRAMRPRLPFAAVLAATALALAACGGSDPSPGTDATTGEAVSGGDLVIAQVTEPDSLPDPLIDGSLAGYNYYYNVFDRLTMLDAEGQIQPQLATEWTSSEDFTTWTYTIRDDATFHNGDPVTVEDVIFTYQQILDTPESSILSYLAALESVEAGADPNTVVFNLNASFSPWPSITTSVHIVPESVYTELGSEAFSEAPVGSGPFQFVSRTRGVEYVMEAYPDYWGGAPSLDTVTFQTVADEDARLNGVLSGSLDVALVSPNQVPSIEGDTSVNVVSRDSNGVTFLGVNTTAGALTDERVRRAIVLAIDLESITDNVLAGRATPNSQIVAPTVAGYDSSVAFAEHDPEQAIALLEDAGYDGEPIVFEYATDGRIPLSSEIAQAIQGFLSEVGIVLDMRGMDQASLSGRVYGTQDMNGLFLNTWAPSTMDGDMPATNMFAGGANDYTNSPETAGLVELQRTVDGQDRVDVFGELASLNIEQGLIIPLYTPDLNYVSNLDLEWQARVDGLFTFDQTAFTE